MISGTMIEAKESGNPCVIVCDFGQTLETFRENELLDKYASILLEDWNGATWPPLLISAKNWDIIGGFSIEFSPGMYSDPDLAMKLWKLGCRHYVGLGSARVYHFPSQSTKRITHNRGRVQFLRKWGMTSNTFSRYFLRRGQTYSGALSDPVNSKQLKWQRFLDQLKIALLS